MDLLFGNGVFSHWKWFDGWDVCKMAISDKGFSLRKGEIVCNLLLPFLHDVKYLGTLLD
jgi:hypothetical protein